MSKDWLPLFSSDPFWDGPVKVILGALLVCLLAPIELYVTPDLPVTLQSYIVLLLAMLMGPWRGVLAVSLYLLMGGVGLPVFASGGAGFAHLAGPTGGFLVSFVPAAWVAGRIVQVRDRSAGWWRSALALLVGHAVILMGGFVWLCWPDALGEIPGKLWVLAPGLAIKYAAGLLSFQVIRLLPRLLG